MPSFPFHSLQNNGLNHLLLQCIATVDTQLATAHLIYDSVARAQSQMPITLYGVRDTS